MEKHNMYLSKAAKVVKKYKRMNEDEDKSRMKKKKEEAEAILIILENYVSKICSGKHSWWVRVFIDDRIVDIDYQGDRVVFASYKAPIKAEEQEILKEVIGDCGRKKYTDTALGVNFNLWFDQYFSYKVDIVEVFHISDAQDILLSYLEQAERI